MIKRVFVLAFITLVTLSGCMQEKNNLGAGKYGMMDNTTPEGAALLFFENVYGEKKSLNALLGYASPKMGRLMKSYHTPRAIQRHVLNLTYDEMPVMQVDAGDDVGLSEFSTEAEISVFFSGMYNGDKIDDLRTVKLVRIQGKWLVDAIKADKFL